MLSCLHGFLIISSGALSDTQAASLNIATRGFLGLVKKLKPSVAVNILNIPMYKILSMSLDHFSEICDIHLRSR